MMKSQKTLANGPKAPVFKTEELNKALMNIEDVMERCMCKFILLGETAQCVDEERPLSGDAVYIGIGRKQVTSGVASNIKTYTKAEVSDDGFEYEVEGVPVKVKFIHRNYKFFKYPEQKLYNYSYYEIPNPFGSYHKLRFFIK